MSDSSRLALELALRACEPGSVIDVVHALAPRTPVDPIEAALSAEIEKSRAEEERRVRAELSELLGKVGSDSTRWNVILTTGDPRQVILDQAIRAGSDLIALGTKGRTGLSQLFDLP